MANRAVTLVWYCKTPKGWRRFPALMSSNGKVRTGVVILGNREQKFPEGRFQLRAFEGRRKVYLNVDEGASPSDAQAERKKLELRLAARISAHDAGTQIVEEPGRVALRAAARKYVQRAKDMGAAEAEVTYAKALEHFISAMDAAGIRYVDEVDEAAMLRFQGWLRQHGNGARTIFNKVSNVRGFLMWLGVDKKNLGRRPFVEKTVPRVYSPDEVSSLLGACDEYMVVVLDVLRMAGLRESEAAFLQWPDIDLKAGVLHVRSKPEHGFTIKDREQRDIPMPKELIAALKKWKKKRQGTTWVLGTRNDKPNTKLLLALKGVARRAGMNCGRCDGCKSDRKECERFVLHSFRRTYATSLARAGVDVHAIRDLLGHSDLQTTLRYLGSMKTEAKRAAVNSVSW